MWSSELPLALLWREQSFEDSDVTEPRFNETYVAPSWSWASAIYPVLEPDLDLGDSIAEVVNIADTPATADIYGQIIDARLKLKGLVLGGMVRHISNSFFGKPMTQIQLLAEDGTVVPGMDYEGAKVSFQGDSRLRQKFQNSDISTEEVICLAIKSINSLVNGRVLTCIVLGKSQVEEGLYERVGQVTCCDSPLESEQAFRKRAEVTII